MFQSDAKLFLSASNNINNAKTLINECKRFISDYDASENSNFNSCKSNINGCDIDALVTKVEETKESLLSLENSEFTLAYMSLLAEKLDIDSLDYQNMSDEERLEYDLAVKEYDYALLYMLEQHAANGTLTDEMEAQLSIQRIKIQKYELNDEMSAIPTTSEEYIDKFKQNAELDRALLESLYTGDELQQKLDEYDAQYNANLDILELNYNINIKSDELEGLEPGTDEYYRKENEIRQLQVDYYTNKGNLTEEEKEFLQFQKDYIQVNKYYIAGDEDKARAMKTQMIDPMTGQCVATDAEIEYENADWWGRTCINAKTVGATFVTSMAGAGETILDGGVMLTAGTVGLFNDDVAQWTEDFVSVNWTDDAYDGLVASGGLNEYSAYSGYHTVTDFLTTTGTYVGLSFIPGVGGSAVMALSAAGSSGQTALDNGATLKEAVGTSWVAGGLAFAADFGLDKLNAAEGVTQALKVTGRTVIGVGEPALNTIAEYAIYGHENSENIFDYAEKTGAYTNIAIGGLVTNISGAYGDYKKAQLNQYKVDFNAKMDSMTDAQRSQSWADYYSGKYGDANVEHSSGIGIDGSNGSFVLDGVDRYNSKLVLDNIKIMQNNDYKYTYEVITDASKDYAHALSKSDSFDGLDMSIDGYHLDNMKMVLEYDSWNIAKSNLEMEDPNFGNLPWEKQESLINARVSEMIDKVDSSPGTTIREKIINSGCYEPDQIEVIFADATKNNYNAAVNGYYALEGVNGAPRAYDSIENYYLDMSNKSSGGLSANVTPEYRQYVLDGFAIANGTNRVSSIYANDNLKYAINISSAKDADILQLSMWDRKPIIEVDMSGKSFGRVGDRQFVSPPIDSDTLFKNITASQEVISTQATVGAATGLPTSGNDRLTRISLNTDGDVQLHLGSEAGSCKEALSGGLPVYEIDGNVYKMREGTIDSLDLSKITDWDKVDLTIDNFSPKTGELISTYKLKVIDGKTCLVLQGG